MNTELLPLCKNLYMLRRERNLSQSTAAKDLGLSQVLLSHYENGARKPSLEFILRACDYYNVTADYMLGRSGIRDGGAPETEDEAPEDNRLVGMASAKLGQSLLTLSLKIIYDVIGRTGCSALVSEVTAQLGTAVARVFFQLCRARGQAGEFFDERVFESASAADMLIRYTAIERELEALRGGEKEIPELSYHNLEKQYPAQFKALLMLGHQASERIKKQK